MLSLSDDIISSEDEVSQDGSEGQHEGESSQALDESIDEYEGEASGEDEGDSSVTDHVDEVGSNSDQEPLVGLMKVTPIVAGHKGEALIMKVTPVSGRTYREEGREIGKWKTKLWRC